MKKYLLPYYFGLCRRSLVGSDRYYIYSIIGNTKIRYVHTLCPMFQDFKILEDAKNDLDRRLIDKGYILLTEEQAERLSVLL